MAAPWYPVAVHACPETERHTTSARRLQPVTAALARYWSATAAAASALAIAVSHAASPSRALMPPAVRRPSSAGAQQATATA